MLTMQSVLYTFGDYLKHDALVEVVMTKHGYTYLLWDSKQEDWAESQVCKTPEHLMDILLFSYACYEELLITHGERDLTNSEAAVINEKQQALKERCENIRNGKGG